MRVKTADLLLRTAILRIWRISWGPQGSHCQPTLDRRILILLLDILLAVGEAHLFGLVQVRLADLRAHIPIRLLRIGVLVSLIHLFDRWQYLFTILIYPATDHLSVILSGRLLDDPLLHEVASLGIDLLRLWGPASRLYSGCFHVAI